MQKLFVPHHDCITENSVCFTWNASPLELIIHNKFLKFTRHLHDSDISSRNCRGEWRRGNLENSKNVSLDLNLCRSIDRTHSRIEYEPSKFAPRTCRISFALTRRIFRILKSGKVVFTPALNSKGPLLSTNTNVRIFPERKKSIACNSGLISDISKAISIWCGVVTETLIQSKEIAAPIRCLWIPAGDTAVVCPWRTDATETRTST